MATKLSDEDILTLIKNIHSDWSLNAQKDHIQRIFGFDNYYQTMAFANAVAWISHHHDHHPEMLINYKTCQVVYSTHSVQGLSDLDFNCAGLLDQLINS
jgi:4a-hydroxytetrahydrobiopterin dehydratase